MLSATDALNRLRDGNKRFISDQPLRGADKRRSKRDELLEAQAPHAIILGCSDSRVPAELVFDQGLGDLFVIRVAGNVVAPPQIGSVEFAAENFGTRLVVVLGHSQCGAVLATLKELEQPSENPSPNLAAIVNLVRPSLERLLAAGPARDGEPMIERAVRANIRASAERLRRDSQILQKLIQEDGLQIVGAEYSLESGKVEFLDVEGSV